MLCFSTHHHTSQAVMAWVINHTKPEAATSTECPARTGSQRFRRRRLAGTGGRRFGMRGPDGGWLVARGLLWYAVTDATQQ